MGYVPWSNGISPAGSPEDKVACRCTYGNVEDNLEKTESFMPLHLVPCRLCVCRLLSVIVDGNEGRPRASFDAGS